jgi:hypothetical protein
VAVEQTGGGDEAQRARFEVLLRQVDGGGAHGARSQQSGDTRL